MQQGIYDKDNFEYGPIHHGALPGIWPVTPNGKRSGLIHGCKKQAKIELGVKRFAHRQEYVTCSLFSDFSWLDTVMSTGTENLADAWSCFILIYDFAMLSKFASSFFNPSPALAGNCTCFE